MKKYILSLIPLALAGIAWIPRSKNNVCKTFDDYYSNRDSNENCYYNPDIELTVPEIVKRQGYPIETYEVITEDDYILTVFRIPHGKHTKPEKRGKPVFLQHGTNSNSGCFVNVGRKSLAFILADEGYDVWLGNCRGSKYSLKHLKFNHTTNSKYWDYSLDEYGTFDLRAELGMIYSLTNQKIIYIGYSLGTTIMYIYTSKYPEIAHGTIELFVNLAPSAFVGEEYFTLPKFASLIWNYVEPVLHYLGNGAMWSPYVVPIEVIQYLCLPFPFQMKLCMIPHIYVLGSSYTYNDPETLPITLIQNCDRSSVKQWTHYAQLWYKQTFENYDYGTDGNIQTYGSETPPIYNLTNIKVPMYFIHSRSDLLSTNLDLKKLYSALPDDNKPDVHIVEEDGFGHLNLIVANNVVSVVHDQIVKVINSLP